MRRLAPFRLSGRVSRKQRRKLLRWVGIGLALVCVRSMLLFAEVSSHSPDQGAALVYDPLTYRRLRANGRNQHGNEAERGRLRVYSRSNELTSIEDGNTLLPLVRGLSYAERLGLSQLFNSSKRVSCEGGKQMLSWDQINDNYCDCPMDGMDEPGTSACDNGRFWCGEAEQRYIFSSRVDDGICDCCDGSDEPEGRCPNDCRQAVQERLAKSRGKRKALEIKHKILEGEKRSSRGYPYDLQQDIEVGLDSVCFSWTDSDFTYELCPFGSLRRAKQKEKRLGNKGVSIGGSPSWKKLEFWLTNGGRCFNGLVRSTRFTFTCSAETGRSGKGKLHRVLETSTCLYSAEILTPLACTQEDGQEGA